jgi:cytochrome P450
MSIEEILCQIFTLTTAGHETTSMALTWTLYTLAKSPVEQRRLRDAIRSIPYPPTMNMNIETTSQLPDELYEQILHLPYLDQVIRESLRLHSPASSTMRISTTTDIIPTSEPWIGRDGKERKGIEVRKGDIIFVPISAVNRNKRIWGEDAGEFRYMLFGRSMWALENE